MTMTMKASGVLEAEKQITTLHYQAREAIISGEAKLREAAECLAKAESLGATQRESAKAIGKSVGWVNGLLAWRRGGYKDCPFPGGDAQRRVQRAEQSSRRARRPRSESKQRVHFSYTETPDYWNPNPRREKKRVRSDSRELLIKALGMLGSEHPGERANAALVVEKQRVELGMTWEELIVPADVDAERHDEAA